MLTHIDLSTLSGHHVECTTRNAHYAKAFVIAAGRDYLNLKSYNSPQVDVVRLKDIIKVRICE